MTLYDSKQVIEIAEQYLDLFDAMNLMKTNTVLDRTTVRYAIELSQIMKRYENIVPQEIRDRLRINLSKLERERREVLSKL